MVNLFLYQDMIHTALSMTVTVSKCQQICAFSFRKERISRDRLIRLRRPAMRRPQSENTRSTYACDAGPASRSSASGSILLYVTRRLLQKEYPLPDPDSAASLRYLASCADAASGLVVVEEALHCVRAPSSSLPENESGSELKTQYGHQ